jgi:capsular polysaccharide biosynthesis protein
MIELLMSIPEDIGNTIAGFLLGVTCCFGIYVFRALIITWSYKEEDLEDE